MDDKEVYENLKNYVEYAYEFTKLPDMFHKKDKTAEWYTMAYQRWAAYEILKLIKKLTKYKMYDVIDSLEEIRGMFDGFACMDSANPENKMMFIEGFVVATDLLDMAISYKWCY